MADEKTPYTFDRVVRMVLSAVLLIGLFALTRYLSDVLLPFVAAVVLAYLLNPLVAAFEKKTKSRGLAVGLTITAVMVVGVALVAILVPLMIGQVGRFRDSVTKLRNDMAASVLLPSDAAPAPAKGSGPTPVKAAEKEKTRLGWRELDEGWAEFRRTAGTQSRSARITALRGRLADTYLGDFLDKAIRYVDSPEFDGMLLDAAKRIVGQLAVGGWTVVAFALNIVLGLTGLIVVLLYLVFLLLDYPEYARTWPTFLPPQYRGAIVEFLVQFNVVLRRYFRGQSVVALLVGALLALGFTLIGLPMAVPFGLFVGLLNMVPYLQMVGIVPALMLAGLRAVEGDVGFMASAGLTLLVFAVVQIIQDALITPRVMGKATGLRPVAILLGVFIWGKLLGFTGLLLAIPLTCLGIAYYRRFVLQHGGATSPPEPRA